MTTVSQAETEARAIADRIVARGSSVDASERDHLLAETAEIIIANAVMRAGLVDRSMVEAIYAEIEEASETAEAEITKLAENGATAAEVEAAVQSAVAQSETLERRLRAVLDREADEAWLEACQKLSELGESGEYRNA